MKIGLIFLIGYFSGFVVMLSSKGGLIALATVIFVSVMYFFYKKGSLRNSIIVLSALAVFFLIVVFSSGYAKVRLKEAFKIYGLSKQELFANHRESTESTAVRLMIWHTAAQIISDNPVGVGTGDGQYALMKKYEESGMTGAHALKLNCHNQFYETTLAIGIHGLIVLIIFLLYILVTAIRKRNFLLLWVAVIVIINLFFESMFERQSGVIFFVFFTGLLLTSVPEIVSIADDEKQ
jgi:O-antigen ligase